MIASCWFVDKFSAGRFISWIFEIVIAHLNVGAQKKIVKGPAAWLRTFLTGVGKGSFRAAC